MTRPVPLSAAELITCPSGYSLDLYCDHSNVAHSFQEFPHSYTGQTFADCIKPAKTRGWKYHYKTNTATCPKCVKALSVK